MSEIIYDHLHIITTKGRKKIIKAYAAEQGKSLNAFVNESINEKMDRDEKKRIKYKKRIENQENQENQENKD